MKIKDVAEHTHLTQKAIRLYEEKGFITPEMTEVSGQERLQTFKCTELEEECHYSRKIWYRTGIFPYCLSGKKLIIFTIIWQTPPMSVSSMMQGPK